MSADTRGRPEIDQVEACSRFARWLEQRILKAGRGDDVSVLEVRPDTRLWLGHLAPEADVLQRGMGDRGERLAPCAVGLRFRPASSPPMRFRCLVSARAWLKSGDRWIKTEPLEVQVEVSIQAEGTSIHGANELKEALDRIVGVTGLGCEVRTEYQMGLDGNPELTVLLVNTSPADHPTLKDTSLYECRLSVSELETTPFLLEGLPDSFRYDRRLEAYGINCGVEVVGQAFITADSVSVSRGRPTFWNVAAGRPDLSFATLAKAPLPPLEDLCTELARWGQVAWGGDQLHARARAEGWNDAMWEEATRAADAFSAELTRVKGGLELLRSNAQLLRAFRLMNAAMETSARGRYSEWRPFQIGFLLANVACLHEKEESSTADIVWFATGGGKTETYLGIVVMAAIFDRLRGKASGTTAWSRFPLRMLSLQQTQRFADAIAAAELVRRKEGIAGAPFSVGFLVGEAATPNRIEPNAKEGKPDPDDPTMPAKYRVLLRCPFCHSESIEMRFNRRIWTLEHLCSNATCPWPKKEGLPFYIVDDEVYRFLPTVIVGTLDKAASISMQGSMRGLVGPPWGRCSEAGHGYTYGIRSTRPHGCLVPGCPGKLTSLDVPPELFAPTLRLQDELHLLKDSLGAVDAHYEALLDHLQEKLGGSKTKILGSSATLSGYEKQVGVLYRRRARVFPALGPSAKEGFWTSESEELARRFVALAPRGQTVEYAVDRTVTELQLAVRRLLSEPGTICREADVPESFAPLLADLYGVDVVYGNTIRDLDATSRSFETQIRVDGQLNYATLTGRTPFEDVRKVLARLEHPEPEFKDRLHLIAASSMMSHGVDIDRLNTLVMIGVPLTTAEFIQTTARVGRKHPGLVFVFPKIARERDASVYRSFKHFVVQGDRFVEPIPITRRSRRVLERTVAGLVFARILHIHEPTSGGSLVMTNKLREFVQRRGLKAEQEFNQLVEALELTEPLDEPLRADLKEWLEEFFRRIANPPPEAKFSNEIGDTAPMLSLRDVEEQAPIFGTVHR